MPRKKKTLRLYTQAFLQQQDLFHETLWINKFFCKLMLQGKKHLVEKYVNAGLVNIKFFLKKQPGLLLLEQIIRFRPLITFVKKRMGRKFNAIPLPVKERRQYLLSLNYIANYIKTISHRDFDQRIFLGLSELFTTKKNALTRKVAEDIKHLAESRIYLHLRWK
jgi:ribosomal protein S7